MGSTIERLAPWLATTLTLLAAACDAPAPEGCRLGDRVACETVGGAPGSAACLPDGGLGPCEPDVAPPSDAGPRFVMPAPPAPPAWRCPAGWVDRTEDGVETCEPWETAPDCAPPFARIPGQPACVEIGDPCPAGDLPDDAPAGAVYVLAGRTSGDGSRAAPFPTIAEAVAVLPEGGTLLLGQGVYEEALTLPAGATVRGACVSETTIRVALLGTTRPAIDVTGPDTVIQSLHIETDRDLGVRVGPGASARIEGVWIDRADEAVIAFSGSSSTLDEVLITSPAVYGVDVHPGASAEVRRSSIVGADEAAVRVDTDAEVVLEDLWIDGLVETEGNAIFVEQRATVTGRRVAITDSAGYAATVIGPSARLVLEDAVIRDARAVSSGGLRIVGGAEAEVRRATFDGLGAYAIGAVEPGTRLTLEDVVVRGTHLLPVDVSTSGIEIVLGAVADLDRVVVAGNEAVGVLVHGSGATLTASDLRVASTAALSTSGAWGRGLQVQAGGVAELTRARLEDNREVSVMASTDAAITGLDVSILHTRPRACAESTCADAPAGTGLVATARGVARLTRFEIVDASLCGLQIADDGAIDLADGSVRESLIGACVQVDGYDVDRLSERVSYFRNGSNLDSTALPVPDLSALTTVE